MAKLKISSLLLSVITVCSFISCSFSDDLSDLSSDLAAADASSPVNLNFTVSTRADEDDALTDQENRIKDYGDSEKASYRVYFYDATTHEYIMRFTNGELSPTGSGGQAKYSVSGALESSDIQTLKTHTSGFIVVFIANWDIDNGAVYPDDTDMDGTDIDALCKGNISTTGFTAKFSCPESGWTKDDLNDLYIPFYGVKYIESLDKVTTDDNEVDLGDINLLRAMAKVKVVNVTRIQNTRATYYPYFSEVKLVHYNKTGYCAPTGVYTEEDYSIDDEEADDKTYYVNGLHLVGDDNSNDDQTGDPAISLYAVPNDDTSIPDSIWVAYVPEYDNETGGVTKCEIQYKVACDGEETGQYTSEYAEDYNPGTISFAVYDKDGNVTADSDYNIQRNRSYRFNVSLPKIFKLDDLDEPDDYDDVGDWYVKKK